MAFVSNTDIELQYRGSFAYQAGYLPPNIRDLDSWFEQLAGDVEDRRSSEEFEAHASVAAMGALIERDGIVRMFVDQMIEQQYLLRDPEGNPIPEQAIIKDIPDLLAKLDFIVGHAPWFSDPHFPMSALFAYVMMTPGGEDLFRNRAYNEALTEVLKEWCEFLDGPDSLHVITPQVSPKVGWLAPDAYGGGNNGMKLWEFYIPDITDPHWGFASYNDYFHRRILDGTQPDNPQEPPKKLYPAQNAIWHESAIGADGEPITDFRPVAEPDNPNIIVSANDGTVSQIAQGIKAQDKFWLKGNRYSLINMLDGHHVERFVGGSVLQSFLSGSNYHRWHSSIDGIVKYAEIVEALTFSEARATSTWKDTGTGSLVYESAVNTRGLVFIESPIESIGMVCVIPIGITEISSVTITVTEGQHVKKGDQLGYFSYGGSTLALVFQKDAIESFDVHAPSGTCDSGSTIEVNGRVAKAR